MAHVSQADFKSWKTVAARLPLEWERNDKKKKKTLSQEQCCKPVKPALRKLSGTGFGVRGQLGSNRKTVLFQARLAVWVVAQW